MGHAEKQKPSERLKAVKETKEGKKSRHLDEVLPLLLARADGLLDAAQLAEDGLSLVQLVVCLTAGHLSVDPARQETHIQISANTQIQQGLSQ